MALADRLAHPVARASKVRPAMDVWIDTLSDTDKATVEAALRDRAWASKYLLVELQAEGAPTIAASTFDAWRRDRVAH